MSNSRGKLPFIEILNWQGLYTKSSTEVVQPEQLKIASNVDFFETYGALAKSKGSSRVLASKYTENGNAKPLSWLGFYKSSDLAGAILRHVIVASGTKLQKLDGTSLTAIPNTSTGESETKGRTSGLYHTHDTLDRFMFITNIDPDAVGVGDQMLKYDGARMSNWGITPPGSDETVLASFYSIDPWFPDGCSTAEETTVTWDGDAMAITQNTNNRIFYIENESFSAFHPVSDARVSGYIPNRINLFVFIPRGQLDNFNKSNKDNSSGVPRAFSAYFGTDLANSWRYDLQKGELLEGWNKLSFDFSTFYPPTHISLAGTDNPIGAKYGSFSPDPTDNPNPDNITYVKFEFESESPATSSTAISNVRLDRFQRLDQGAPNVSPEGSGTFDGAYQYKITYVNKIGNESNTGPSTISVTASDAEGFYLGFVPTSPDQQVVSRRIYRTVANGTIFLRQGEIFDNVTTSYKDRIPDGSLSEITAPQAGDFSDDNSPPPKAGIVKKWKKTLFLAGDPQNPTTLYFSDDDEPESWPLLNAFELDDKITGIYETYSGLVVETETGKWQVVGDNPDFAVDKIIDNMGCVGRRAAGRTRLLGYSVDRDGMRLFDLQDTSKVSEPIRDKYDDLDKTNIEKIHTVHSKARNSLVQFNPDSNGDYTGENFLYQYAVDDVRAGWWSSFEPPSTINMLDAEEIEDSNGDFHVYAGTDDGMILEILTTTSKNWTAADGTETAVTTEFQTPWLRLGGLGAQSEGVTGKVEPTDLEIRAEGDAAEWVATVEVAKGPDQPTVTASNPITFTFGTNNTLLRYPVKFGQVTREEYVRITLKNSESDVASTIKALKLYFHVREGQFPVTDVDNT